MADFAASCDPNSCGLSDHDSMHASNPSDAMCSVCARICFELKNNRTKRNNNNNNGKKMLGSLLLTKRIELLFKNNEKCTSERIHVQPKVHTERQRPIDEEK